MRLVLSFFAIVCSTICLSCHNSQSDASKLGQQIQNAVKENSPSAKPTSPNGVMLRAKIDGKEWSATGMTPPDRAGLIVGENGGESISLPYYDRRSFLANQQKKLGEGHELAEMRLNDEIGLWTGTKGALEITKVDENWAEGTFYFTAKGFQSEKTKEVTDGFFRISLSDKK
jgi:hypothetical protein